MRMKQFRALWVIVAAFVCFGCGPSRLSSDASAIDAVLSAAVASGKVPGVAAAAASHDRVLYQSAFGKTELDSGAPLPADAIFQIASMTKAVTSVAVMQLVEAGKVALDDPAHVHLPELKDVQVLDGFDSGGKPILRPPSHAPTVRELLAHTAGYGYSFWNENIRTFESGNELPTGRERYLKTPLAFDPGSRWGYGPNTDVLGILVEAVSGLTLEQYFRERIFDPLKMPDTRFQATAADWPRVPARYQRTADGGLGAAALPRPEAPPRVTFFSGGGGLTSTVPDYIRFLRALLNGGELDGARILSRESIELMAQNQIGELEAGTIRTLTPNLLSDVDFFPNSKDKFGLGFLINADAVQGGRSAGSMAWAGLFNTYFWVDRENDICGVLMTQILPFGEPVVLALLEEYERAVYATFKRGGRE